MLYYRKRAHRRVHLHRRRQQTVRTSADGAVAAEQCSRRHRFTPCGTRGPTDPDTSAAPSTGPISGYTA
ncbi:hypothetical protein ACOMHN_017181 [Nucella lapillus]